ncbi:MAG: rod shape-determining protein MreD [Bacillota bacterium]
MRTFALLLLIGTALLLEQTVLNYLRVAGVKPDLVLLLVIFNGILKGSREGAFWGFIAGLMEDFACGHYIGLNALGKLVGGYFSGLAEFRVYKDSAVTAAAVVWATSLVAGGVVYVMLLTLGIIVAPSDAFLRVLLPVAVYNALLSPLFYRSFHRATFYGFLREERF